jgi:hypothetical protein
VDQHEGIELRGRRPDRLKLGIVEVLAGHVGADLCARKPEHGHSMAKLIGRLCRGLHGQRGNGAETLRTRLHQLGELLVLDARKHARQCGRLAVEEGLRTTETTCTSTFEAAMSLSRRSGPTRREESGGTRCQRHRGCRIGHRSARSFERLLGASLCNSRIVSSLRMWA